jgi:hypothetical protein
MFSPALPSEVFEFSFWDRVDPVTRRGSHPPFFVAPPHEPTIALFFKRSFRRSFLHCVVTVTSQGVICPEDVTNSRTNTGRDLKTNIYEKANDRLVCSIDLISNLCGSGGHF